MVTVRRFDSHHFINEWNDVRNPRAFFLYSFILFYFIFSFFLFFHFFYLFFSYFLFLLTPLSLQQWFQ
jgi:hypothetical protein